MKLFIVHEYDDNLNRITIFETWEDANNYFDKQLPMWNIEIHSNIKMGQTYNLKNQF